MAIERMLKKITPIFFVLSISIISAQAQSIDTTLRHRLFLSFGFNHTDSRDEQASPLLYYGDGNPLGFGYEYRGNSYRHSFRFTFAISAINANNLTPDLQNDPFGRNTFFGNAFLTYSYLQNWKDAMDGKFHLSLGGAFDNLAFLRIYKYYGDDLYASGGAPSWEGLSMLCPAVCADYYLSSNQKIYSQLSIPLVSLVGRPDYNLINSNSAFISGKNFHMVLLGGLVGWNYSLAFEQAIWDALEISAAYNSRYYRYSRYGWTTSVLIQDVTLQLNWRFEL